MREALKPLSNSQKQNLGKKHSSSSTTEEPELVANNVCSKCGGSFKNSRGVAIHERRCSGSKAEVVVGGGIGLEPLFLCWYLGGNAVGANEKKIIRTGIRVWLFARMKSEFYKGLAELNPDKKKVADDGTIKLRLAAAGRTIVKCIVGDHGLCGSDSFVCSGEMEPIAYSSLPYSKPLRDVPFCVIQWLASIVDAMLSPVALDSTVVNGRYGTTSLVESAHHEIRKTVPKGFPHRRNETQLIKSGLSLSSCSRSVLWFNPFALVFCFVSSGLQASPFVYHSQEFTQQRAKVMPWRRWST